MASDLKCVKIVGLEIPADFGAAVKVGDLVYLDSTADQYLLADADSIATYAQVVVVKVYDSTPGDGSLGVVAKEAYFVDEDAPYGETPTTYYLSTTATAGNTITSTRPTGNNDLCQVVATSVPTASGAWAAEAIGTSTCVIRVKIEDPREETQYVPFTAYIAATTALAALDSGPFVGPSSLAANDYAYANCFVPDNAIALVTAAVWFGNEAILQAATTYTLTSVAGAHSEAHDAVTDSITATAMTNAAADDLNEADISTAFDATGLLDAGNIVGLKFNKAAEAAGDEDPVWIGVQLVYKVV